jgi:hypothetical protein
MLTSAMHAAPWDLPNVRLEASSLATKQRRSSDSSWTQNQKEVLQSLHQRGDKPPKSKR